MSPGRTVECVLCQKSEETTVTGKLSTKDGTTAHQNCLLFSSGIYCQNSPQFDDLFGFSVEDVVNEVKRGKKLICRRCRRKGATVGCEVGRCKKSYHYPCAVSDGANSIEDPHNGHYRLYCLKHYEQAMNNSLNGNKASSSKKIINQNGASGKKRLSFDNREGDIPAKRNSTSYKRRITDHSRDSDLSEPDIGALSIFAPLDSDIEENVKDKFVRKTKRGQSEQESRKAKKKTRNSKFSDDSSGPALENEQGRNKDLYETAIVLDSDFETMLLPVGICRCESNCSGSQNVQQVVVPNAAFIRDGPRHKTSESVKHLQEYINKHIDGQLQSSEDDLPSPYYSNPHTDSHPESSSSAATPNSTAGLPVCATQTDSTKFWKWCNNARCTEVIFSGFITEMAAISRRIQSNEASQEDYDIALKVMKASGKLEELIAKQQEELQKKQVELQEAAAALDEVTSALRDSH